MKKNNFRKTVFTATLCLFTGTFLFAQEEDIKKVHIMVKENNATTVDTSFTIDEDMNKDEIQKKIHELTGMDVKVHHKGDKLAHAYAFTIKDSADIDADVKEMEVEVTIDMDGESHTVIHKHGSSDHMKWADHKSGAHYVIVEEEDKKMKKSEIFIVRGEGEGDETKVIRKVIHKGGDMIMITEEDVHKDDNGNVFIMKKEVDGKKIIVLESSEKPVFFTTKDGKELELIVKEKKSGTDIALDEVRIIMIETTKDGVINIVVSDKKEREEKKAKEEKKKKVNKKK